MLGNPRTGILSVLRIEFFDCPARGLVDTGTRGVTCELQPAGRLWPGEVMLLSSILTLCYPKNITGNCFSDLMSTTPNA